MITQCFDQGEDADSQKENNVSQNCLVHRRDSYARQSVPETIREAAVPRTAECEKGAADRADYRLRWSDCQLTADTLRLQKHCAYQKGILVQKKSSVIGGRRIFLTKMHTTDGKGICRSS